MFLRVLPQHAYRGSLCHPLLDFVADGTAAGYFPSDATMAWKQSRAHASPVIKPNLILITKEHSNPCHVTLVLNLS
ncbi:hypothetical protein JOE45_000390 [Paenibacillus sp. PvR098]|nr:hypothetical protein [Paenibacillus sp. PvP091]MBP1168489.1 hypothetical protein [Paenibacillus sp. PvR098]MBP2439517.1 hypothetical protein [Paenibacillus sp. PvP052]